MQNSKISDLVHACMEVEKLSKQLAIDYDTITDDIELVESAIIDEFRYSTDLEGFSFYINIQEIEEETKYIKQYAIGATDTNQDNIIRYDNANHHNKNKKVNAINPPHHKHKHKDESNVDGSTGSIDEIIKGLEESISKIKI